MKWCNKLLLWFLVHAEMFSTHINHGVVQAEMGLSVSICLSQTVSQPNTTPKWASGHFV